MMQKTKQKISIGSALATAGLVALLLISFLGFFAAAWYVRIYGRIGFDSILFTLTGGLGGVDHGLIRSFLWGAAVPAVLGTVTVSLGKEEAKVLVPNLMGLTEMDGTMKAIEAGLQISSVSYVFNSEYEEGKICYQSYSEGSWVEPGTGLEIKVSKGAETYKYKCNLSVTAPTAEEAPGYKSGDPVKLKLVTDDNTVLLETEVKTFPQSYNYSGLTSSGGTLTMTYTVETIQKDEEGNVVSTSTEEKSFTKRIEFTVE